MSRGRPTSKDPTHVGRDETRWQAIALDAAGGLDTGQLCARYGYSSTGMRTLLASPRMQQLMEAARERYANAVRFAQQRVALSLPDLVETELAVALPTGTVSAATDISQRARHFLIKQVWPTVTKVDQVTKHELSAEVAGAAAEVRTLLQSMNEAAAHRRRSILDGPHVLEGSAALPQAQLAPTSVSTAEANRD